nr:centromere protein X isoform X3 [Marmota flaviventris]
MLVACTARCLPDPETLGWQCFQLEVNPFLPEGVTLPPLQELVSRLLHLHFKDSKTKVSGDALQLMVEFLRIFVVEAAVRGVRQAQAEGAVLVDVDQLEKVLPQLLLDF